MIRSNSNNLKDMLHDAQRKMVETLKERLDDGSITHQEMSILQKMLKDNGIVLLDDDEDELSRVQEKTAADLPAFNDD